MKKCLAVLVVCLFAVSLISQTSLPVLGADANGTYVRANSLYDAAATGWYFTPSEYVVWANSGTQHGLLTANVNITDAGCFLWDATIANGVSSGGDTGLCRAANGVIEAGTGSSGSSAGTFKAAGFPNASGVSIVPITASLTTTSAGSDTVALTGMASSGHCQLTATNASAATNLATTYISAKTSNQITVAHAATAAMTYDVVCTAY
jgi:hypothetical protein